MDMSKYNATTDFSAAECQMSETLWGNSNHRTEKGRHRKSYAMRRITLTIDADVLRMGLDYGEDEQRNTLQRRADNHGQLSATIEQDTHQDTWNPKDVDVDVTPVCRYQRESKVSTFPLDDGGQKRAGNRKAPIIEHVDDPQ